MLFFGGLDRRRPTAPLELGQTGMHVCRSRPPSLFGVSRLQPARRAQSRTPAGRHDPIVHSAVSKAQPGGCLACHLKGSAFVHPQLTAKVGDEHCFECRSRSGRAALSHAGVAEVQDGGQRPANAAHCYLRDGRRVEKLQTDAHHRAGMSCIDCDTSAGLKAPDAAHEEQAVDIQREDCHQPKIPRSAGDEATSTAR